MIRETLLSVALAWTPPTAPRGHAPEPRHEYDARITTQVDAALSRARAWVTLKRRLGG